MDETILRLEQAISMMRDALAILDQLGEADAALHLQHAISIASREPTPARSTFNQRTIGPNDR